MTKPTVGIIGLGAMGAGIAKTLRNNGFTIHVCDVRPGVADAFVADGGTAHATTAALAAVSDVVVSVVVNAAQTESVLFGDDGKGGAASAMRPGSTFVMCSTVDPNWSVALEARLNALGLHYVDAPISGGAAKAASGQMTMMTSAKPEAYAAANAVLDVIDNAPDYRHVKQLVENGWLDIGSALARQSIDALVPAIITQEQADAIKALGEVSTPVDEFEVRKICWSDDGEWAL